MGAHDEAVVELEARIADRAAPEGARSGSTSDQRTTSATSLLKGDRMKYMIEYSVRTAGLTHDQNFTNQEALLNAFGKWEPEEGLTVLAFVSKVNSDSGYVLVEADDPKVVASFVSKYIYWNDVDVIPVVDVAEIVAINLESLAWARAASSS
jgi:hypothetical protein